MKKLNLEKIKYFQLFGVLLLILVAGYLLWSVNLKSNQSQGATSAQVSFSGEYLIEGESWQPIEQGTHISTSHGNVTLRLTFELMTPSGEPMTGFGGTVPIGFYTDHIFLSFYENGIKTHSSDIENPGIGEPACGVNWTAHYVNFANEQNLEVAVNNPHAYGNENAIDEMLSSFIIMSGTDFEKAVLDESNSQRTVGILLLLVSVVFFGIALFSTLIHVKSSRIIWLLGLVVMFAGLYFAFSAKGVCLWSKSVVTNTTVLGASMIFYMLFSSMIIVCLLRETKLVANIAALVMAVIDATVFIIPAVSDILFYDTWLPWIIAQTAGNIVLAVCIVKELISAKLRSRLILAGAFLPLVSFSVDALCTGLGVWKGGITSKYVFLFMAAVAVIMVLKLIPNNINAAAKAKELEMEKIVLNAELAETRISTMMSQIRPHFIYNTLGSIEQLCELDPPKAGELVHDFAKYLRGNFGELDNPKPIPMSKEMEHVHHYISIENVRFPDMTFSFEMKSEDFSIPALTIQPIVENAIKHGLMKLPNGGTIRVVSYETADSFCVSVVDDGVGFDTSLLNDDRKHVGLRNIRERLKAMVGGSIEIESTVGEGTSVLITIPKEYKK